MAKHQSVKSAKAHKVVSPKVWISARKALLVKEKKFTKLRDQLSRQRRDLPWEKVDKMYIFDGPNGRESLSDLFRGKHQLIVYHFMFSPDWEEGCKHCSFWADHYDPMVIHLGHRDVSFAVISRAPLEKINAFKNRMGWKFTWLSSDKTDFNYDFYASFTPDDIKRGSVFYNYVKSKMNMTDREGISVFYKDDAGAVYHTYSTYARGIDMVNTTYQFLDLVPKGRDEDKPNVPQSWVRYHDRYGGD